MYVEWLYGVFTRSSDVPSFVERTRSLNFTNIYGIHQLVNIEGKNAT